MAREAVLLSEAGYFCAGLVFGTQRRPKDGDMMETYARRGLPGGGSESADTAGPARLSPLAERAHELPAKMARGVSELLRPRSTPSGQHRITVAPMSADWLQQAAVKSGKRGDPA